MASFDLDLQFCHKPYRFRLISTMSSNDVKRRVAELFPISKDVFEIQVYDECSKCHCILDDEYMESLHERLPRRFISTLSGDIILNCSPLASFPSNSNEFESSSDDNAFNTPEEVSVVPRRDDESECFEELLVTTAQGTEQINRRSLDELNHFAGSLQSMTDVTQINSQASNDEIKRNICHPDTSAGADENALHILDSIDHDTLMIVQDVINTVVKQPPGVGANPVESSYINSNKQNLRDLSPHLPSQISRQTMPVQSSPLLEFAHDVHPYQKTQHDSDEFHRCLEKHPIPPYIRRLQGIKTDADKGKSILPRVRVSPSYISLYQQQKQPLFLMVAVVQESKINNRRILYACNHMQFLPNDKDKITEAVNPIKLNLRSLRVETDGTFNLSLRLVNTSSQCSEEHQKNKLFYDLDEEIAANLHPSPFDPRFFRLACILATDNNIAWDTLCLSDYIRPKQRSET